MNLPLSIAIVVLVAAIVSLSINDNFNDAIRKDSVRDTEATEEVTADAPEGDAQLEAVEANGTGKTTDAETLEEPTARAMRFALPFQPNSINDGSVRKDSNIPGDDVLTVRRNAVAPLPHSTDILTVRRDAVALPLDIPADNLTDRGRWMELLIHIDSFMSDMSSSQNAVAYGISLMLAGATLGTVTLACIVDWAVG